jgi:biotin synthase
MSNLFLKLQRALDTLEPIDFDTALEILNVPNEDFPMIMGYANKLRVKTQGEKIRLCNILNIKSGACSEDCAFCAQSAHHDTENEIYPMLDGEIIAKKYNETSKEIRCFGVVSSGEGLSSEDIDILAKTIAENTNEKRLSRWSGSLGIISDEQLLKLKNAGMTRFHHNIETAKSYYPQICTTHSWEMRADMAKRVKKMGLNLCCGGIMGVGESKEQRVELAMELSEIGSDIIPMNFLVAIKGTKLENEPQVLPLDILKTVAMFRFVNPKSEIKIAGGRVLLRDLQSMVFFAGANSLITGNLLTTPNCNLETDKKILTDLELSIEKNNN